MPILEPLDYVVKSSVFVILAFIFWSIIKINVTNKGFKNGKGIVDNQYGVLLERLQERSSWFEVSFHNIIIGEFKK